MVTTTTNLIVRYAETDAQGVVHHANYLVWFEEARSDFLRQQGLAYSDMERDGFYVVVSEVAATYRAPAFYEDRICIETTLAKARSRLLEFTYRIRNSDAKLLVEGRTRHIVVGADKRPVSLPKPVLEKLLAARP
ncbi:acyl-CoA thioesterase [Syntrophotalea carbinolica DSM 2380]|uniref:Acyl-CoA thioesterase n=1 Tax=Syntrophotalea carbinolica (strain DSM 2380 / NBRC 103641 / GraBd1) TaxID=338963 RepID=Q3A4G9_SYNC1|nr:thioesterase family protein [Syntrophotalea carbinolica]ABA88738.1 acyl-CoA thioesterase [Syntrophotalea carbinolica DSM 2380]